MAILCILHPEFGGDLLANLRRTLPKEDFRIFGQDRVEKGTVEAALIWRFKPGIEQFLENTRFVSATGAGVDHLVLNPLLPDELPVTRIDCEKLARVMADYCVAAAFYCCRDFHAYGRAQRRSEWSPRPMRPAEAYRIGVLGQGSLGYCAALKLAGAGFDVRGWSRTPSAGTEIPTVHGPLGLAQMLPRCDVLINLLPLTNITNGILNASLFRSLPRGAALINVARGGHLMEQDLIEALDRGHLSTAVLDVHSVEPLSMSSPLWQHPQIFITPHVAAQADPETVAVCFSENIRRSRSGERLLNVVDRCRQY